MLQRTLLIKAHSSAAWVASQAGDLYVREARRKGYIARSAFKLLQLDDKHKLISSSSTKVAVDLGASPGGWCQVIRERAHPSCTIFGVDRIALRASVPGAQFVIGDFSTDETKNKLLSRLQQVDAIGNVDIVTSDMCPNRSGGAEDQHRIAELNKIALEFAVDVLAPGGHFVCKVLGNRTMYDDVARTATMWFTQVLGSKPDASRVGSSESFLVCQRKLSEPRRPGQLTSSNGFGLSAERGRHPSPLSATTFGLDNWPGMLRSQQQRRRR